MSISSPDSVVTGLYREHHAWLVHWLLRRVQNTADAADLAQDTFLRVMGRQTDDLMLLREPRAMLTTIGKGLVIDHWRRQDIERAYLETLAALPPAHAPSPEARQIALETLIRLDALLDDLKPAWRCALLWTRLEGITVAEVATRLNVSVATAERYLAKALRRCYEQVYAAV
ncbi:sigma-70 family RNA polymerase sigma factor [Advenella kashmirensis]|uniref:sigma-70 family RNA polymerase sigma factor n=1 Tax=Advenella kashmirensis TaxID=310575 RepID=UPI00155A9E08|nr:sigma-70 family RNA polymerase sigma factor [Advenella kashmirensis]